MAAHMGPKKILARTSFENIPKENVYSPTVGTH